MKSITPEVIKKYISKGLSVFPVMLTTNGDKVEKKPVVEWTDYQKRFATDEEISIWCSLLDFNALGMATGKISGITVLDIDDPKITEYDSEIKVATISGGFHLWYKYKPGMRNSVRVGDKLMDVRGDGGFVVVPPSALGKRGYTWLKYDFAKLADFPVVIQHQRETTPVFDSLPEASDGNRNETAIRVAGHMVAQTNKNAWETTAWTAFRAWNEHYVTPPLEDVELRRTFDSATRMEAQKHDTSGTIKIFKGLQSTDAYERLVEKWKNGLTTGYELLDNFFTFMPEQMYLLSAPTHMGKTTVALNIASRVASIGNNVLFCSLEQGLFIEPRVRSSLGKMPETLSILTSDKLIKTKDLIDSVTQMPERLHLLVIDHLHFMAKDSRNGVTSAIDQMIIDLQNTAKTLEIPVLVISHLRKLNEEREPTLDDLRDSSSLSQVPSVVMQLYVKKADDKVTHQDIGSILIRKNRITGKLGRLAYEIKPSGEVVISPYIGEKKIRI